MEEMQTWRREAPDHALAWACKHEGSVQVEAGGPRWGQRWWVSLEVERLRGA